MFWESLLTVEKVYFVIGCVASGLLLIQLIMLLIGFGGDGDVDGDVDMEGDSDGGIGIFTIKGIIAFFALGAWIALAASKGGVHWGWTLLIFFVSGTAALIGVGLLYKYAYKLQSNGNIDSASAIGKVGEVYLTIPANKNGHGKLTVTVQGKLCEVEAVTNSAEPITTGRAAKIVGVMGDVYIVEPFDGEQAANVADAPNGDSKATVEQGVIAECNVGKQIDVKAESGNAIDGITAENVSNNDKPPEYPAYCAKELKTKSAVISAVEAVDIDNTANSAGKTANDNSDKVIAGVDNAAIVKPNSIDIKSDKAKTDAEEGAIGATVDKKTTKKA